MWVVGVEMDLDTDVEEDSEDGAGGDNDVYVGVCVPQSIIRNRSNAHVTHMRVIDVLVDNWG